jgi:uncharacterized protein YciI
MPLYVISWSDKPNSLDARMAAREAHLAYVRGQGDRVKLGGPFLDGEGQMAGSLILYEADSLEDAKAFHAADPYKLAGLFDHSEVRPWRFTTGAWGPPKS